MPSDQAMSPAQKAAQTKGPRGNRKAGVRAGQTGAIRAEVTKAKSQLAALRQSLEKIEQLTGAVR